MYLTSNNCLMSKAIIVNQSIATHGYISGMSFIFVLFSVEITETVLESKLATYIVSSVESKAIALGDLPTAIWGLSCDPDVLFADSYNV
jgi:hypothetical protein